MEINRSDDDLYAPPISYRHRRISGVFFLSDGQPPYGLKKNGATAMEPMKVVVPGVVRAISQT